MVTPTSMQPSALMQIGGIDSRPASSWRRTCAARVASSLRASRPAATLRRKPCHMCRWVSTKPGITMRFAGVDHLRVRRADVRLHRGDLLAFDQHVGLLEIADRLVERKHAAALDQDRPAELDVLCRACAVAPVTPAASAGAAATPAAVVQRNCRRDRPSRHATRTAGIECMCHEILPGQRFLLRPCYACRCRDLAT